MSNDYFIRLQTKDGDAYIRAATLGVFRTAPAELRDSEFPTFIHDIRGELVMEAKDTPAEIVAVIAAMS